MATGKDRDGKEEIQDEEDREARESRGPQRRAWAAGAATG